MRGGWNFFGLTTETQKHGMYQMTTLTLTKDDRFEEVLADLVKAVEDGEGPLTKRVGDDDFLFGTRLYTCNDNYEVLSFTAGDFPLNIVAEQHEGNAMISIVKDHKSMPRSIYIPVLMELIDCDGTSHEKKSGKLTSRIAEVKLEGARELKDYEKSEEQKQMEKEWKEKREKEKKEKESGEEEEEEEKSDEESEDEPVQYMDVYVHVKIGHFETVLDKKKKSDENKRETRAQSKIHNPLDRVSDIEKSVTYLEFSDSSDPLPNWAGAFVTRLKKVEEKMTTFVEKKKNAPRPPADPTRKRRSGWVRVDVSKMKKHERFLY